MTSAWLKPSLFVGAIALAVIWFLSTFERVPVKERVGPSGEARMREFLAAERFAERMGLRARELRALPDIDRLAPGVLILPAGRQALDSGRRERIVAWVKAGGHLITEAEFTGVDDPMLDALGAQRGSTEQTTPVLTVTVPGGRDLKVLFSDRRSVQVPGEPTLRAGDRLVSWPVGKGRVTLATTLGFAQNWSIGDYDHAEFLWALLQLTPATELQVFARAERLSLTGFLATHALPALAAGAALLAFWLWRIAPRFGPVAPDAPPGRRRLLDHLRASGRYYWAQGLRGRLVDAARDAALRAIGRSQPDFPILSASEKQARLAAMLGTDPGEAARFLGASAMRGADFIRFAQHARDIHSALERGRK